MCAVLRHAAKPTAGLEPTTTRLRALRTYRLSLVGLDITVQIKDLSIRGRRTMNAQRNIYGAGTNMRDPHDG